jgi:4a-hydroxytetrahydrobiopterin dehydratase
MASIKALNAAEINEALRELDGWSVVDGKVHQEFEFADFVQAFGFMTQVALLAERAAHHPEWFNVYNQVVVDLTTHEAQGITQKDLDLAREMEQIAQQI